MFKISPTHEIFITRGDSSGPFGLAINLGSTYEPDLYEFINACGVYQKPDHLEVKVDRIKFKKKATVEKLYIFEYNYTSDKKLAWLLDNKVIDLSDWGISFIGTPERNDKIIISFYLRHISEIYLNVFGIHNYSECYYLQKIYRNDGKVITNKINDYSKIKTYDQIIDKDQNLVLRFEPDDTENFEPGEYRYQIKMHVYDRETDEWITDTINHPTAFYVTN